MNGMIDRVADIVKDHGCVPVTLNPGDIVFEERVKLQCFYCSGYGTGTCPPNIPDLDYPKLIQEYSFATAIVYRTDLTSPISWEDRKVSSNKVCEVLGKLEKYLWENDHPLAVTFQAGRCKLCSECVKPCRQPEKARIPFEAIGVNVIKTMEAVGITMTFPPRDHFYRVGLVLW